MEMSENGKFGIEKAANDQSCSLPAEWQFGASSMNLANPVIPMSTSECPSVTMATQPLNAGGLWSRAYEVPSFAFARSNVPISANSLPNVPGVLQHCPVDSAFIERAARFSCFSGDSLSAMINNTFVPPSFMAPYSNVSKGTQLQNTDFNMAEAKDVSSAVDRGSNTSSPVVNQKISTHEASFTEGSQEANTSSADAAGDSSPSGIGGKKRRITQDVEMYPVEQGSQSFLGTTTDNAETKLKGGSNRSKSGGKTAKDNSPEALKEDYVHIRARRGQATNSHSLAERVRREKISERMKYLQDLVPGCNKVTGKAVMLDEIINYVQSLQRQVEFLSMKLAAVNPRLDYNLEALLAKDLFHSRSPPLSMNGFSRETMHPLLHLQQQGFAHTGGSGIGNTSDSVRSMMNTQLATMTGYKDPSLQIQNSWDQDLQNAMQMTYNANPPRDEQE